MAARPYRPADDPFADREARPRWEGRVGTWWAPGDPQGHSEAERGRLPRKSRGTASAAEGATRVSWLAASFLSVLGGLVTFFVCLTSLPPSIEDLERNAAEIVPADSELTNLDANTGATIVVGWERWAVADFEDERPYEVVHELLLARAHEAGWTVVKTNAREHDTLTNLARPFYTARISIGSRFNLGQPTEASRGHVTVARDEELRFVLFWSLVAAGAALPAVAAYSIWPSDSEARRA